MQSNEASWATSLLVGLCLIMARVATKSPVVLTSAYELIIIHGVPLLITSYSRFSEANPLRDMLLSLMAVQEVLYVVSWALEHNVWNLVQLTSTTPEPSHNPAGHGGWGLEVQVLCSMWGRGGGQRGTNQGGGSGRAPSHNRLLREIILGPWLAILCVHSGRKLLPTNFLFVTKSLKILPKMPICNYFELISVPMPIPPPYVYQKGLNAEGPALNAFWLSSQNPYFAKAPPFLHCFLLKTPYLRKKSGFLGVFLCAFFCFAASACTRA